MVVEAVVIVLVVVFCFLLFHTYSKVQFILSNAICQSTKKQQQKTTQKRLISSASMPHTVLLFKERQCGASLVPIVLGIL